MRPFGSVRLRKKLRLRNSGRHSMHNRFSMDRGLRHSGVSHIRTPWHGLKRISRRRCGPRLMSLWGIGKETFMVFHFLNHLLQPTTLVEQR